MEFETFKKELLDHLRQILGEEKKICFQSVEKNNGIREEAVVILEEGARIAPTYGRNFQKDPSAECVSGKGGRFFLG